jgi:hypothetical protein
MHRIAPIVAAGLGLLLAACAQTADLKPRAGKSLPVAPFGREDPPKAAELLQTTPQAAPERSVELQTRSEQRPDDPFDLPPQ